MSQTGLVFLATALLLFGSLGCIAVAATYISRASGRGLTLRFTLALFGHMLFLFVAVAGGVCMGIVLGGS